MLESGPATWAAPSLELASARNELFRSFAIRFGFVVACFPALALVPDLLDRPGLLGHFLVTRSLWTLLALAYPVATLRGAPRAWLPWILYGSALLLLVLVVREQVWLGDRVPEILITLSLLFVVLPVLGVPFTWKQNAFGVAALLVVLDALLLLTPALAPNFIRLQIVALFLVASMGFVHHQLERLFAEQYAYRRQIEDLARHDPLTGLYNRRAFTEHGERALKRGLRAKGPVSLALLDLDHFKAVNDRHGHGAGDAVIRAAARLMAEAVRETDVVARVGGEEFVLLLPGEGLATGAAVAERVRRGLEALAIQVEGLAQPLHVTASLGLAEAEFPAETLDSLMTKADQALYRAKGAGRNRLVVHQDPSA